MKLQRNFRMNRLALVGITIAWLCPILISMSSRPRDGNAACAISEHGKAQIDFPKRGQAASTWIRFKQEYKKPPLILAGQCGTSGQYVFVMAENISRTTCRLTAWMPNDSSGYKCDVAYIVIGEIEDE